MKQEEDKRGFIWYALRVVFLIMLLVTIIHFIILFTSYLLIRTFAWIILISIPLTFILSIIHFFMYKNKKFPIIVILVDLILFVFSFVVLGSVR